MTLPLHTAKDALRATTLAAAMLAAAMLAAAGAAGCVSTHMPSSEQVASSEAAIRSARDLGAERLPDASAHLELARRQLAMAQRAIEDGDEHEARWMLMRADTDARLALALAREARAREAAEDTAARVRELSSAIEAARARDATEPQ